MGGIILVVKFLDPNLNKIEVMRGLSRQMKLPDPNIDKN